MDNFDWFNTYTKGFLCDGSGIEILDSPDSFYKLLQEKVLTAQKRIIWSSLYFGTGKLEKELAELLIEKCQSVKAQHIKNFNMLFLLDYLRGSRPVTNIHKQVNVQKDDPSTYPLSPDIKRFTPSYLRNSEDLQKQMRYSSIVVTFPTLLTNPTITSRDLLLPLIKRYPEMASVYLYQSPKFNWFKKLVYPGSVKEIAGLNHVKAYIFDDDIIISGANLSESYFTNRQDRYMLIRSCGALCDHIEIFIRLLCKYSSFRLLPDDTTFDMRAQAWKDGQRKRRKTLRDLTEDTNESDSENSENELKSAKMSIDNAKKENGNEPIKTPLYPNRTTDDIETKRSELNRLFRQKYQGKKSELSFKLREHFDGTRFERQIQSEIDEMRRQNRRKRLSSIDLKKRNSSLINFFRERNLGDREPLLDKSEGKKLPDNQRTRHSAIEHKSNSDITISAASKIFHSLKVKPSTKITNPFSNNDNNKDKTNDTNNTPYKFAKVNQSHLNSTQTPLDIHSSPHKPKLDTVIYPLIQAKPHGNIVTDYLAMSQLLRSIQAGSRVWIATGYFNLVPSYEDILLNRDAETDNIESTLLSKTNSFTYKILSIFSTSRKQGSNLFSPLKSSFGMDYKALYATNILLASPEANGFFGGRGFKKYVPFIYLYAAKLFYDKIRAYTSTHYLNYYNATSYSSLPSQQQLHKDNISPSNPFGVGTALSNTSPSKNPLSKGGSTRFKFPGGLTNVEHETNKPAKWRLGSSTNQSPKSPSNNIIESDYDLSLHKDDLSPNNNPLNDDFESSEIRKSTQHQQPNLSPKPASNISNLTSSTNTSAQIKLWEYTKLHWTYHAKGLWLYEPLERYPCFTLVGSSNFGYRSVHRDIELQFAIFTKNGQFKQKLHKELDGIVAYTNEVNEVSFSGTDRHIPWWVKILYRILKSYF